MYSKYHDKNAQKENLKGISNFLCLVSTRLNLHCMMYNGSANYVFFCAVYNVADFVITTKFLVIIITKYTLK